MRILAIILTVAATLLNSSLVFSNEGEDKPDTRHENFFEINSKAISTLNVKSSKPRHLGGEKFRLPLKSLLVFGEKNGVFIQKQNKFKLIEVTVLEKQENFVKVKAPELKPNDKIVSQGVPLLRVVHLEASGQGGEGHGH